MFGFWIFFGWLVVGLEWVDGLDIVYVPHQKEKKKRRRLEEVLAKSLCELAKIKGIDTIEKQDAKLLLSNSNLLPSNADIESIKSVLNNYAYHIETPWIQFEVSFNLGLALLKDLRSLHGITTSAEVQELEQLFSQVPRTEVVFSNERVLQIKGLSNFNDAQREGSDQSSVILKTPSGFGHVDVAIQLIQSMYKVKVIKHEVTSEGLIIQLGSPEEVEALVSQSKGKLMVKGALIEMVRSQNFSVFLQGIENPTKESAFEAISNFFGKTPNDVIISPNSDVVQVIFAFKDDLQFVVDNISHTALSLVREEVVKFCLYFEQPVESVERFLIVWQDFFLFSIDKLIQWAPDNLSALLKLNREQASKIHAVEHHNFKTAQKKVLILPFSTYRLQLCGEGYSNSLQLNSALKGILCEKLNKVTLYVMENGTAYLHTEEKDIYNTLLNLKTISINPLYPTRKAVSLTKANRSSTKMRTT